ncbi:alpha/beta hydrolase [Methyloligella sp. 2.7D]|uniref:alpha/beta hydrolase n=1 Tax=unclassified Methyloligella TaxID=2625955 RepID=UPI00157C5545|nr:alpha/beta hydrolase [Methyloligella sp. GL2]QKP76873.1 alpha/beta hydrolase [Methyloligella sp. GL2]
MGKYKPRLEPGTQSFWDSILALKAPLVYTLSPEDARASLLTVQNADVAKPPAEIEDIDCHVGPTGEVPVRIVRPEKTGDLLPVVIYFHGGGWILGNRDTHDRLIRELAVGANVALVFVDYSLSPEAHYPVPLEQAYAVTKYIAEHGEELEIDGSNLAVAGDSAGGNMAAAVTLLAKERGGPKIAFQLLFYPVTDANFKTGSYKQFGDGPWLTKPAMKWFWNAYLPKKKRRKEAAATPLNASLDQLKGLPEALIVTAECDVLRDEGEAYARKLAKAGVPVTATRYLGTMHDFVMLNALRDTQAAKAAMAQAIAALKTVLHGEEITEAAPEVSGTTALVPEES